MYVMIYMNLSFIFFFFSLYSMICMFNFFLFKLKLFFELNLISFNSMNFSLVLYFDYKSFMFMMTVLLISSMIIIYSIDYMSSDLFNIRFIFILMLFVLSMLLMIIGQNLLMILLGWDGLGLISYCLVIYYNNWNSFNSGMITVLTNRLGDIGLLISIGLMMMYGDFNYLIMGNKIMNLLFFFLIICCFTKSAQMPFSVWLPLAMAAPTPISALVHSSTLVTAGVYLLMRLENFMFKNMFMILIILILSELTMFFSGFMGIFENDLKKIIALSTLSQLGLMMISLIIGLKLLSFFHLIIHAMFKSLLFMCAGLILHSMNNNQDIRNLGVMNSNYLFTLMFFICSNFALCGFPFMSGFYSKDLILEFSLYKNLNLFLLLIFYLSISMTVLYTFRLIFYMIKNYMKFFSMYKCSDNLLMNFSMFFMYLLSIISGFFFSLLLFNSVELILMEVKFKFYLNFLLIFSIFIMFYLLSFNMLFMIYNFKKNFKFFNSMWMMNYFTNLMMKKFFILSLNYFILIDFGYLDKVKLNLLKIIFLNISFLGEKFSKMNFLEMFMICLWIIWMFMMF